MRFNVKRPLEHTEENLRFRESFHMNTRKIQLSLISYTGEVSGRSRTENGINSLYYQRCAVKNSIRLDSVVKKSTDSKNVVKKFNSSNDNPCWT